MSKNLIRASFFIFSLCLSAAIIEGILRLADYPPIQRSGWPEDLFDPPTGRNQLGYRGRSIAYGPDDFVVVLLGDSSVWCDACPDDQIPEITLEQHLLEYVPRPRVFSVSGGGYGLDQQLLGLQRYFSRYRANLIIHWQTFENDIWNNVFPTHWPGNSDGTPKPTFRLVDGKLLGPSEGLREKTHRFRLSAFLFHVFYGGRDHYWEKFLPPPYEPSTSVDQSRSPVFPFPEEESLQTEKAHRARMLTPVSERGKYGLDLMRALLFEIKKVSEAQGAAFVTFQEDRSFDAAERYVEGEFFFEQNGKYYKASVQQMRQNRRYVNRGLDYFLIEITTPEFKVSETDAHLNLVANSQVLGDLVGELFSAENGVSQRFLSETQH